MSEAQTLSKDAIHTLVAALVAHMNAGVFMSRVKAAAVREPIPQNEAELLTRYEEAQAQFFDNDFSWASVAQGDVPEKAKVAGADTLAQLRVAVKRFPDKETERAISQLCLLEESQLMTITATVPELRHLAQHPQHPHSHGHHAGGAPQHAHGGAHGHSHGNMEMNPQMLAMMDSAMATLNPEQQQTLRRVQDTMNGGSPPSPEDMRKMFEIQRHIMAFMQTMQQFSQHPNSGPRRRK